MTDTATPAPGITVSGLTKRFGHVVAVDDASFSVTPGRVTGFLGPNGAGKTTTLRMLLGLVRPTSGSATIDGTAYGRLHDPAHVVGASLEATTFHPGRTAFDHLRVHAAAAGLETKRIPEVLDLVGLREAAKRRVGGYSLGMRQRLGLATALLGDPRILILDEPINGLDPEGIRWIRDLLRFLAGQGRTVLISSHVLSEVQQTVEEAIVVNRGRIVYTGSLAALDARAGSSVLVDAPDRAALGAALAAAGLFPQQDPRGLRVDGASATQVGHIAFVAGLELSGLSEVRASLEDVFLSLIAESTPGGSSFTPGRHTEHSADVSPQTGGGV